MERLHNLLSVTQLRTGSVGIEPAVQANKLLCCLLTSGLTSEVPRGIGDSLQYPWYTQMVHEAPDGIVCAHHSER